MKVTPITPIYRAVMSVRYNQHTVVDMVNGKEYALPAKEAWELHEKLNKEGIVV